MLEPPWRGHEEATEPAKAQAAPALSVPFHSQICFQVTLLKDVSMDFKNYENHCMGVRC